MTNTRGNDTVVVDSDALIGLINEKDDLHKRCLNVASYLAKNSFATVVPYPIILEAATTLAKDKTIRRPDLAKKLLRDYAKTENINIVCLSIKNDDNIAKLTAKLYTPRTSKKNSPFDFYVLAAAKKTGIGTVFSFDSFYSKNGLKLAEELLEENRS